MIQSYRDSDTRDVADRRPVRKFSLQLQNQAQKRLMMIDIAEDLDDLKFPPGNKSEKLVGERSGQHSIRIYRQWRICFIWHDGDAYDVEIVDYH